MKSISNDARIRDYLISNFFSVLKFKIQYNGMWYSQEDEWGKIGGKTDILNFYKDEKTVPWI